MLNNKWNPKFSTKNNNTQEENLSIWLKIEKIHKQYSFHLFTCSLKFALENRTFNNQDGIKISKNLSMWVSFETGSAGQHSVQSQFHPTHEVVI